MKRSETATEYILLKAETNSEWDDCEFVIARITPEWLNKMRERLQAVQPFKDDFSFSHLAYYGSPEGYYTSPDGCESTLTEEVLKEGEQWAFVTIEVGELESLPVPENELDAERLFINKDGTAHFIAWGEYSNEEFWTEDFDIAALIRAVETGVKITELKNEGI